MPHLTDAARLEYYLAIGAALPPPAEPTEASRQSRYCTAVEAFNALCPTNAYEALLAVQIVVCGVHAIDCLRCAGLHPDDFGKTATCRNQAAAMLREARAAKRILAQEQKQRLSFEAMAAAEWARQSAAAPRQAEPVLPAAPRAEDHQPAAPLHLVATTAASPRAQAESAPPPSPEAIAPEAIAKAEAFALDNVIAAAQIREDGGVTPANQALFRGVALPTDPAVMDALIRGGSQILDALNGLNQDLLDIAA